MLLGPHAVSGAGQADQSGFDQPESCPDFIQGNHGGEKAVHLAFANYGVVFVVNAEELVGRSVVHVGIQLQESLCAINASHSIWVSSSDSVQLVIREVFHGLVRFIWLNNVHCNSSDWG